MYTYIKGIYWYLKLSIHPRLGVYILVPAGTHKRVFCHFVKVWNLKFPISQFGRSILPGYKLTECKLTERKNLLFPAQKIQGKGNPAIMCRYIKLSKSDSKKLSFNGYERTAFYNDFSLH